MSTPDVTVVVAVYNTMPYLTECLNSLVRQTIGTGRMQIVTVDDGSTDRGGAELDRFDRRYPGLFTVIHQANSGGPAGPFNRGIEAATGRYVFFVGADDRLGPEALERLVKAADEYGSDVVLGRVVGVNSRHIYQDIYQSSQPDVDLFDSPLPRSLANTKLYRRELLNQHGIRYPEDMKIGSDLPFTLAACFHARRISVLADYDYYFAVRRFSATNITYLSRHGLRIETVEKIMTFVANLIEPGERRDAIMVHRFDHEVARLLEDDVLKLDRPTQEQLHRTVGRLAGEYLTDRIAAQLGPETRIRLAVARHGTVDDLIAVIRQDAEGGVPDTVERGGRRYAAYPGFGTLPDEVFDVTDVPDWDAKLDATGFTWAGDQLVITANGGSPGSVSAEEIPARVERTGKGVTIRLDVAEVLARSGDSGQRRAVSAQPGDFDPARALGAQTATGAAGAAAVRAARAAMPRPVVRRRGGRLFAIAPTVDESGRLMISVVPLTARRVLARLQRSPVLKKG
ncbi:glycosyl transferase [Actinoplanes sp. SE50]|uniref:glycosyltransferase family 2 protein n=1 Tax=unclassified Actinoplanes TaxID=2626549 RepID=UPI00023EC40A|nr:MULTISPECIES: glycosyltransferase [unclassified Actinoplanes]AEV83028.1 Polypeptide N-acetylgalactosaminyltransferase 6 [Actinoplanes sp. SE50/110]ATO81424.1 glycosyl transferase [Actinoplanes sp. SE50]SLL98831.1 glycosyl transferase [Actinoplanes sp. SE50/110]